MRLSIVVGSAGLVLWCSTPSFAQSIGLYSDSACSSCNASLQSGDTQQIWVSILADGSFPTPESIAGGEFRVAGMPVDWAAVGQPMPYVFALGDPVGAGVRFAIQEPQAGPCIPVYVITLTAMSARSEVVLSIQPASPPSNAEFNCPRINVCDGVCDTHLCVPGGVLFVNSGASCSVSTQRVPWTRVKFAYR
jgi:hypothetical protein